MADSSIWWLLTGVAVAAELMTGTFYLLVVALACVAGGAIAGLGYDIGWQWGAAALVEVVGTLAINRWKRTHQTKPKLSNNLDIGAKVSVLEWNEDGTARVAYRGTQWDAILESPSMPRREHMVIVDMRGALLVLGPAAV